MSEFAKIAVAGVMDLRDDRVTNVINEMLENGYGCGIDADRISSDEIVFVTTATKEQLKEVLEKHGLNIIQD